MAHLSNSDEISSGPGARPFLSFRQWKRIIFAMSVGLSVTPSCPLTKLMERRIATIENACLMADYYLHE